MGWLTIDEDNPPLPLLVIVLLAQLLFSTFLPGVGSAQRSRDR
jgi:hypothetical protein